MKTYDITEGVRHQLESLFGDRIEQLKASSPKLLQGFLLFIVLFFTYRYYIGGLLGLMLQSAAGKSGPIEVEAWFTFPVLLKFFLINGWAFAVLAFFNKDWTSKDAAIVLLLAFVAASGSALHRYGLNQCPRTIVLSFPFIVIAAISHTIGAWRHPPRPVEFKE